jgi:hypothetical protein
MLIELAVTAALMASAGRQDGVIVSAPAGVMLDGRDSAGTWLWHRTIGYRGDIGVATRRAYPYGRADSVRRPGFNGSAWTGETFVGGVDSWAVNSGSPGAAAYGAVGSEDAVAMLRAGPYVLSVNPFEEIRAEGKEMPRAILKHLEAARVQWLKDHGYLGGVRSFRNDYATVSPERAGIDLTPKAIIPSPTDEPRFRNKMQVRGVTTPNMTLAGATRVSLPPASEVVRPPVIVANTAR